MPQTINYVVTVQSICLYFSQHIHSILHFFPFLTRRQAGGWGVAICLTHCSQISVMHVFGINTDGHLTCIETAGVQKPSCTVQGYTMQYYY